MSDSRFGERAHREMASMFDDVSGRYDLLNRLMTLGQDGAWREAMWRRVPRDARVVLDLCTGSGVSLTGLRQPGRLVLGMDVSLQMLQVAGSEQDAHGWGPRLACADGFRLPLRPASLDAVTLAFGPRNLRPRDEAMREIARVLRPGGRLVVLEATAPRPGPLAPAHRFWVRHMVPLLGRLSPDPSAYEYLSRSIFEFGSGPEFERDLAAAGFEVIEQRRFLLGATGLWVAERRAGEVGGLPDTAAGDSRLARALPAGNRAPGADADPREVEARTWLGVQLVVSAALSASLAWALAEWVKLNADLPLTDFQRRAGWVLVVLGVLGFAARTAWLGLRWGTSRRGG